MANHFQSPFLLSQSLFLFFISNLLNCQPEWWRKTKVPIRTGARCVPDFIYFSVLFLLVCFFFFCLLVLSFIYKSSAFDYISTWCLSCVLHIFPYLSQNLLKQCVFVLFSLKWRFRFGFSTILPILRFSNCFVDGYLFFFIFICIRDCRIACRIVNILSSSYAKKIVILFPLPFTIAISPSICCKMKCIYHSM